MRGMVDMIVALVSQKDLFFALLFALENNTGLDISSQISVLRQQLFFLLCHFFLSILP